MNEQPRLLAIGAHPDDCDLRVGGLAALYTALGYAVKFVSVTNGDAGHHEMGAGALARRRRREAEGAGKIIGAEYEVLDIPDGELMPTLENRKKVIEAIRTFRPSLVLTHRPNDYHPDHRYTAVLVQDAAFLMTVPNICPLTPRLEINPVIGYMFDDFQKPLPFTPSVIIDTDEVVDKKYRMLECHVSQVYEWLPFIDGYADKVPAEESRHREFLEEIWGERMTEVADKFRAALIETYGETRGRRIKTAEAFEICEYGSPLDEAARRRLFPFLPE